MSQSNEPTYAEDKANGVSNQLSKVVMVSCPKRVRDLAAEALRKQNLPMVMVPCPKRVRDMAQRIMREKARGQFHDKALGLGNI